jgi:alkaline phosphatase
MKLQPIALGAAIAAASFSSVFAAPTVSRLTPPSLLFNTSVSGAPYIARFLPGQRFDLQATVRPDAGQTITSAVFKINNVTVPGTVTLLTADVAGLPANTVSPTLRAHSIVTPGVYTLTVTATQSDNSTVTATGEFEVIAITTTGRKAKNVIFMIGDGMGIAHRTAARVLYKNIASGKRLDPLVMDTFPATALVGTASLNSIITDSAPGAACYSTGNKCNNNQEGVFPDDTNAKFDNPRVEFIGEYLARTQGKALGIVTTADVFDATPAAFAIHTQDRGAGTGICDQYLDEAAPKANLRVLLGGGRKWFLPSTTSGSARVTGATNNALSSELAAGWGVVTGSATDNTRDLLADFQTAGFAYAPDKTALTAVPNNSTKLLGLFALSNMNVAKDKLDKRRGVSTVVDDYGFPDQPLLEEMTDKALKVLKNNAAGFVLMVEGASIDKQAHNMDTERWLLDTVEFDKAIGVAKQFAIDNPDTLIIVTADHECAGVNIIGASVKTNAQLQAISSNIDAATGKTNLQGAVGTYDLAGFPVYSLNADGYPAATDIDYKMLIGYAGNADRNEDWLTNPLPLRDSQQPFNGTAPLNTYPNGPHLRDTASNFFVTGQVAGTSAVHTGSDIPASAFGRGSSLVKGSIDNTDLFFIAAQAAIGGAL